MSGIRDNKLFISVVTPALNEEKNIPVLYNALKEAFNEVHCLFELVVVDDGSTDSTREVVATLSKETDSQVKGVFLARNFGHQAAFNAGIDATSGDAVIVMDADLQHPPSVIPNMVKEFNKGADIVLGIRKANEQNSIVREFIGTLFYRFINKISDIEFRENAADFGLYSRQVIETLKALPEKDRFLRGLVQWVGFTRGEVVYTSQKRQHGVSKYSYRKLIQLAMIGVTSFSAFPLRASFWLGLGVSIFSFIYALYIVFVYATGGGNSLPPGWPSIMVVILFFGGLQFMILGIIGEFLFRQYQETKGRPLYIVHKRVCFVKGECNQSKYGIINE